MLWGDALLPLPIRLPAASHAGPDQDRSTRMSKPLVVGSAPSGDQETRSTGLFGHGMTASLPGNGAAVIRAWIARRRQRQALGGLDDHLLRDIGLPAALREAAKWFWQR